MSRTAIIPLMLGASAALAATQDDAVLYRYRNETLSTSRYGPIAAFQKALDEKLQTCKPSGSRVTADGSFGLGTQKAIVKLVQCYALDRLDRLPFP